MPKKHHDGEDVLEEDEVGAAQRMSSEKNKKGAKLNTVGCCGVKYILAQAQYSGLLWCESFYRIV